MPTSLPQRPAFPVGKTAASAVAWQFRGELRVTAIVKATFAFAAGGPMPLGEPQPIVGAEIHHGKNPVRSVRFTTDLVPYRKDADVLFTGYAHSPPGGPVESMSVRLGISDGARMLVDKAPIVRKKGGFQRIPLIYEHAFGGIGCPENPFGEEEGSDELNVLDRSDPRRVAGFAPIPRGMLPRKRQIGPLPLPPFGLQVVPIPDTFDFSFFQASPEDQRTGYLRGDEWILLDGLHPTSPSLRMRLPGARGLARAHGLAPFGIPDGRLLSMVADTLHVSGDEQLCTLTWRGSFAVPNEAALASVLLVAGVELPGQPIAWPDPADVARSLASSALPAAATPLPQQTRATLALATLTLPDDNLSSTDPPPDALPFRASSAGAPPAIAAPASARAEARASLRSLGNTTLPIEPDTVLRDPLPFKLTDAPPADIAPEALAVERAPSAPAPPIVRVDAPEPPPPPGPAPPKPRGSPWAPPPPAAPPPPPAPARKAPPKLDVRGLLYGKKKGR